MIDLKSIALERKGSSPFVRTNKQFFQLQLSHNAGTDRWCLNVGERNHTYKSNQIKFTKLVDNQTNKQEIINILRQYAQYIEDNL